MKHIYALTKSLQLEVKIFEAKVFFFFFFVDTVLYIFSGVFTYFLWKKFLKVLLFHQSFAKFAVEITNLDFSHSY